jgi:hypothetical protein
MRGRGSGSPRQSSSTKLTRIVYLLNPKVLLLRLPLMTKVLTHREELLEAVRASLRAKVAALAEDNWMYEREGFPKQQ